MCRPPASVRRGKTKRVRKSASPVLCARSACKSRQEGYRGSGIRVLLSSLQAARGVAALMVVGYHAQIAVSDFIDPMPTWVRAILDHGDLGVDFFFVLSGFIITYAHFDDVPNGAA